MPARAPAGSGGNPAKVLGLRVYLEIPGYFKVGNGVISSLYPHYNHVGGP